MIVLSGAELVLPDRILSSGTLVIDGGRIVEIRPTAAVPVGHFASPFASHYIVPGFIDVHVHGVEGLDALDDGEPIAAIARAMPRYGVTGFCPTTVACSAANLRRVLEQVRDGREVLRPGSARTLPAHLESNFVNREFRGAQPAEYLRTPSAALLAWQTENASAGASGEVSGADVLREIERAAADVGIVTLAPELEGALDLIGWLSSRGHRVSLGHSAATYEQATAAIEAGASQATHLFNCMPQLHHRTPGLAGAVLETDDVAAEVICDGRHVHPAMVRTAVAAKGPSRLMAITDATAAAALPAGRQATLGGRPITAHDSAAFLSDGTMAGGTATMDEVFRVLVEKVGLWLVDAAMMCATTPARELGLVGHGVLAEGAAADLVILNAEFRVVQTYVGGHLVYSRSSAT